MKHFQYKAGSASTFTVKQQYRTLSSLVRKDYNKKDFGNRNQAAEHTTIQEASDIPLGSRVGGAFLAQAYRILALSVQVPSSQNLKKIKSSINENLNSKMNKLLPMVGGDRGTYLKPKYIDIPSLYDISFQILIKSGANNYSCVKKKKAIKGETFFCLM